MTTTPRHEQPYRHERAIRFTSAATLRRLERVLAPFGRERELAQDPDFVAEVAEAIDDLARRVGEQNIDRDGNADEIVLHLAARRRRSVG